jgi:hypothetical protein
MVAAYDSPGRPLEENQISEALKKREVKFRARIFLMWNSGLDKAIPVPLGHMDWEWEARIRRNNGSWQVTSPPFGVTTSSFKVSSEFPEWEDVTLNSSPTQCHPD